MDRQPRNSEPNSSRQFRGDSLLRPLLPDWLEPVLSVPSDPVPKHQTGVKKNGIPSLKLSRDLAAAIGVIEEQKIDFLVRKPAHCRARILRQQMGELGI